jgi:replicative DNA helicase
LNLFICDESRMTVEDLRADIARLKARHGIRWFVLDYLYLMAGGDRLNETERTTMLSRHIKQICKDFEVAGITVSSVTKAGMDGMTTSGKASMRGSGQQIHDADVIIFMREHQPRDFEVKDAHIRTLSFEKGRELDVPNTKFNLYKHDGYPLFENMTTKDLNR